MAHVAIRQATAEDRETLETLIESCYGEVYPGWYDQELLSEAMPAMLRIDAVLLESGRYFAALADGRTAGCGGWSAAKPAAGETQAKSGQVRHFATHPDFMRKGVGAAILNVCIAEAKREGLQSLRCFSSIPAESFYARHGFRKLDDVSVMMGDRVPFPAILMELKLV